MKRRAEIQAPYGRIVQLATAIPDAECWNNGKRFTLPAGTLLRLEHAYDATHTTCMAQDPSDRGKSLELFPGAYRWIVHNEILAAAAGIAMPAKTVDLIGDLIAYESGEADDDAAQRLFAALRSTGMGRKLQGHYSSRT